MRGVFSYVFQGGMEGIERADKATQYGFGVAPPRRDSTNTEMTCADDVIPKTCGIFAL